MVLRIPRMVVADVMTKVIVKVFIATNWSEFQTKQVIIPATLMAMFIKVNLLENLTLLSPRHWSLEKVKNVNMGRRRREG